MTLWDNHHLTSTWETHDCGHLNVSRNFFFHKVNCTKGFKNEQCGDNKIWNWKISHSLLKDVQIKYIVENSKWLVELIIYTFPAMLSVQIAARDWLKVEGKNNCRDTDRPGSFLNGRGPSLYMVIVVCVFLRFEICSAVMYFSICGVHVSF